MKDDQQVAVHPAFADAVIERLMAVPTKSGALEVMDWVRKEMNRIAKDETCAEEVMNGSAGTLIDLIHRIMMITAIRVLKRMCPTLEPFEVCKLLEDLDVMVNSDDYYRELDRKMWGDLVG